MKPLSILVAFLTLTLASAGVNAYPGMQPKTEKPQSSVDRITQLDEPFAIENVVFTDADGKELSVDSFKGKVVMINYWATWCPPCIREIPALKKLEQSVNDDDFVFLPVSIDLEGKAKVDQFLKDYQIGEFHSYYDPKQSSGSVFPLDVIPASFILNRKGELVAFARTYIEWDDPKALQLIQSYLNQK
ncbi:TlpA family protein disulfide reductase [Paraferrimonas haliotis]|uniref:Alkyl hydroperoxide reductase n=1 Tax=Paraferrimonas haliotis TaxID=2013866 RepID=A0AA37U206_9GAMM|nr:TlpA disulfide reductase family protein [Paraferrimonas haliotis]GLS84851.1 alkyl hydroperoxide reductase [Paraferrimonas haliotis]